MVETWKDIPGYEGHYQASDQGQIRSLSRRAWNGHVWHDLKGRILRPGCEPGESGKVDKRLFVALSKDGKVRIRRVAVLVLTTFVGPCPKGMYGCHNDGDPKNNRLDNLRWDTPQSNQHDRFRHGTAAHKLNPREVPVIRKAYKSGAFTQKDLGEIFGVTQVVISAIVRGKIWKEENIRGTS